MKASISMDASGQLSELLDLSEQMGITIRRAPAREDSPGGALVRLKGQEILFLDSGASVADQVAAVAAALAGRQELADRFIRPEIRQLLDAAGN